MLLESADQTIKIASDGGADIGFTIEGATVLAPWVAMAFS